VATCGDKIKERNTQQKTMWKNINVSGQSAVPTVLERCPFAAMCITRRLNGNLVVLQVGPETKGKQLEPELFWLDVDPSYQQKARKKGNTCDRVAFGKMDYFAYGISVLHRHSSRKFDFTFKQFDTRLFTAITTDKGSRCYMRSNGLLAEINHMHLHDKVGLVPSVEYVELRGKAGGQDFYEKITVGR
jgi:hypothetical protein